MITEENELIAAAQGADALPHEFLQLLMGAWNDLTQLGSLPIGVVVSPGIVLEAVDRECREEEEIPTTMRQLPECIFVLGRCDCQGPVREHLQVALLRDLSEAAHARGELANKKA